MTSETVKLGYRSSPSLFQEIEKVFVEDAIEVVIAVAAPLENSSEVAQVGDEIETDRGLLGAVTAIEVGTDTHVDGRAEKLAIVVDVVGQGLEVGLGLIGMGGDATFPAGDDHPDVEGDPDDGSAIGQRLDLLVGELAWVVDESPTIVVACPNGTLKEIEGLPKGLVAEVGGVENEA
jgi:hypothetical protein